MSGSETKSQRRANPMSEARCEGWWRRAQRWMYCGESRKYQTQFMR